MPLGKGMRFVRDPDKRERNLENMGPILSVPLTFSWIDSASMRIPLGPNMARCDERLSVVLAK